MREGRLPRPALTLTLPEGFRGVRPAPPLGAAAIGTEDRQLLRPDAEGRLVIPLADRVPWALPAEGVPAGWEVKEFAGRAAVELVRSDGRLALRLRSEQASFALYRDVVVDPREFPYLEWWWKAVSLPRDGDVRAAGTDDQVAQVYVIFPRWPSPRTSSDVIGYVWDTRAPVGTHVVSVKAPNVRLIVVESGSARRSTWQRQERNVAEDYVALFGRPAGRVGQVALMIDSNDTRSEAEALIAGLGFARRRAEPSEIPTSMLR